MVIYDTLRQKSDWQRSQVKEHQDVSPNERLMLECASKYYHEFWGTDGVVLTDELNNPNFDEIVDNCKNGVPYDTKHDRTDSRKGTNGNR